MSPVPPIKLPEEQFAALEAAYARPPRAYHDFNHVREVLRNHANMAAGRRCTQQAENFPAVLYLDAANDAGSEDTNIHAAALAVANCAQWNLGQGWLDERKSIIV